MNKKEEQTKETKKESFTEKLKDKKYKAKVELTIGFGLIVILLIYSNIAGIGNNYNYNNTLNNLDKVNEEEETFNISAITNNYSYNIDIYLTKKIESQEEQSENNEPPKEESTLTEYTYNYNGKRYEENTIINKVSNNITTTYYKKEDKYYTKNNEEYILDKEDNIFDLIEEKYILIDNIKEYIDLSSLDHTTNYSTGNVSYVYDLKIKDIIKNYTKDKTIKIEINIENNLPTIIIDYSNLLNIIDESINECRVTIKYTDINKIEEFTIIEKQPNEQQPENNN